MPNGEALKANDRVTCLGEEAAGCTSDGPNTNDCNCQFSPFAEPEGGGGGATGGRSLASLNPSESPPLLG